MSSWVRYRVKYQPGCCVLPKVCSGGEADNSARKLSPDLWKIHCHCHFTWGSIVKNQNLPDIQTLIRLWSTLWCHHPSWRENCEVVAHRYAIFGSLNIILSTSAPPQFEFPRRVEIYLTSGLLQFGSPSEALAPAKWNKDKLTLFSEKNNDNCVFLTFGQSSGGGGGTDWWFQTTTILVRDSTSPRVWITWAVRIVSILRTFFLHNWRLWWKSFKTEPCDKNPSKGLMENLKEAAVGEDDIDEVVMMRVVIHRCWWLCWWWLCCWNWWWGKHLEEQLDAFVGEADIDEVVNDCDYGVDDYDDEGSTWKSDWMRL